MKYILLLLIISNGYIAVFYVTQLFDALGEVYKWVNRGFVPDDFAIHNPTMPHQQKVAAKRRAYDALMWKVLKQAAIQFMTLTFYASLLGAFINAYLFLFR